MKQAATAVVRWLPVALWEIVSDHPHAGGRNAPVEAVFGISVLQAR